MVCFKSNNGLLGTGECEDFHLRSEGAPLRIGILIGKCKY